jgi:hypothetical protein
MWSWRSDSAFPGIFRSDSDFFAPHYYCDYPTSKRFQPFDEIVIRTAQGSTLLSRKDRLGFIERFALCFQVESQVLVGGVDADVSQPIGNGAEVNTGSQQMYCCAVSHAVRMKPLVFQGFHAPRRFPDMLFQDQSNSKTRYWSVAVIEEDAARLIQTDFALRQMRTQRASRFSPQRTATLLAALAS